MRLSFDQLRQQQRTAWTASVISSVQSQLTFERFFPRPEYLPLPWYGRVRQWLARPLWWMSRVLEDWSASADQLAEHVNYRQRAKPSPRSTGEAIQFRSFRLIPTSDTSGLIEPASDDA